MRQKFMECHEIAMRKKMAERSKNQKSLPMTQKIVTLLQKII